MRRPLPLVLAPLFFTPLLVSFAAQADRIESSEQLYQAGAQVNLPGIGATITLPPAPGGWSVLLGTEGTNKYDVLRRQDPTNPLLTVELNRPKASNCAGIAGAYDKLIGAGLKLNKNPNSPLAPATFASWAYELPAAPGKSTQKLCTNTPTGPVLASVGYEGPAGAIDPGAVQPLLEEVARATGGTREAVGGGGLELGGGTTGTMVLPASKARIKLPEGWKTTTMKDARALSGYADVVERPTPGFFFLIKRVPGKCNFTPSGEARLMHNRPYVPKGFRTDSVELPTESGWLILLERDVPEGCLLVGISTNTTPEDPMITEVSQSVLSPVAETGSGGGDLGLDGGGSSGGSTGGSSAAGYYLFGLTQLAPEGSSEKYLALSIGLDVHAYAASGVARGYFEVAGNLGAGANSYLPYDAKVGIGGGFGGSGFSLVALLGVGGDGMNGKDGAPKMDAAGYLYYGGRLAFSGGGFGLAAGLTFHSRLGDKPINKETRFFTRFTVAKWAFDFIYTQYKINDKFDGGGSAGAMLGGYIGYHI